MNLIHNFFSHFCSDEYFVILCHADRQISIQKYDFNQSTRFSSVFSLSMPHNFDMESPRMNFNSKTSSLIVYNASGSILYYKWEAIENKQIECNYAMCSINHQFVDESFTSDGLSLNQKLQLNVENERKIQLQKRKAVQVSAIADLKNSLNRIKSLNSELPDEYQLDAASFEIDKRITADLEQRTERKFKAIQTELQRKIDKIRMQAIRMEHLYLDNLEHWPITLTGFR